MTGYSTPASSIALSRAGSSGPKRPATIAELAQCALSDYWDPSRELKYWLRTAQRFRNEGKTLADQGHLEDAFVHFARAATIVLEKLPEHRDYHDLLNTQQRQNLAANGQDILESLSQLKPTLVDRYEDWVAKHGPEAVHEVPPYLPQDPGDGSDLARQMEGMRVADDARSDPRMLQHQQDAQRQEDMRRQEDARQQEDARRQEEARRRSEDDLRRQTAERQAADERRRQEREGILRRQLEAEAASYAASRAGPSSMPAPTYARARSPPPSQPAPAIPIPYSNRSRSPQPVYPGRPQSPPRAATYPTRPQSPSYGASFVRARSPPPAVTAAQQTAAEYRRRQDGADVTARSGRPEAADAAIRAARQAAGVAPHRSETPGYDRRYAEEPAPRRLPDPMAPQVVRQRPVGAAASMPNFGETPREAMPQPQIPDGSRYFMPLENPARFEDDTDRESNEGSGIRYPDPRQFDPRRRRPSYPPPITTTTPAPHGGPIRYPSLMSQHQLSQGYRPSLQSGFAPQDPHANQQAMLFGSPSAQGGIQYPSNPLPQPPVPSPYQNYITPSPPSHPPHPHPRATPSLESIPRSERVSDRADPNAPRELKTVSLPRECLPRFLSIAAVNTARNRETCGLLLGKDRGSKYVVTTLLIPKQRSTSDTCAMEEEELVLQFTEERSLITLGWIHTHPTQSCFMSSVDLHTHCGFQRMLPESFAVVCAPQHTPNFGIFRLTDPPGLETILQCTVKEAFHPHPDVPIYTDADKGHVVMKDMSLEIVDLR